MKHLIYESDVERRLIELVKRAGGLCIKVGYDGWPDRLVVLPGGRTLWVELKRADGKPSTLQLYRRRELINRGCAVEMPYSADDVDRVIAAAAAAADMGAEE